MVQIARYFGSEFLRPELEQAKDRMVNLVSLYLEHTSGGDLRQAAEAAARQHPFCRAPRRGSDMLKALIAMPQNSHFGMNERGGFTRRHIPLLAKWSLRSLADYQAELAKRSQVAQVIDAAIWLADATGHGRRRTGRRRQDAEAVIRTALLVLPPSEPRCPDWVAFEKMIAGAAQEIWCGQGQCVANRKRLQPSPFPCPSNCRPQFKAVVRGGAAIGAGRLAENSGQHRPGQKAV